MAEIDNRFEEFIKAIRPSESQLDAAKEELDFLEKKLRSFVGDGDAFIFVKALRSGSYAKKTLLKRHEQGDFDADIGIYLNSKNSEKINAKKAQKYIESLLRKVYEGRTMRKPTFDHTTKSSIKVKFENHPKINLDVVPIETKNHISIDNWGEILRKDNSRRETSITEHIAFIADRNKKFTDTPFNQIVMIWKWWRNHKFTDREQEKFNSFFLETYLGKAFNETYDVFENNWIKNILKMGEWMLGHRFSKPVWFDDDRVPDPVKWPNSHVVVLDPLNKSNNITHDWAENNKIDYLEAVSEFCEILTDIQIANEADDIESELELLDNMLPNFSDWSN